MTDILILGAGYTGMGVTMGLAGRLKGRADVRITLVNPQTRFTERLRLHQTASGQDLADLQIPDRLAGTGVDFVQGWVTSIDAEARPFASMTSTNSTTTPLSMRSAVSPIPSPFRVDEFAYTLNSAQDAETWPQLDRLGGATVVVAGGGLTGVESAAEIAEQHPDIDVVLLSRDEPGSMMAQRLAPACTPGWPGSACSSGRAPTSSR